MGAEERAIEFVRLPVSPEEAFAALDANAQAHGFLPEPLMRAFAANTAAELALARDGVPTRSAGGMEKSAGGAAEEKSDG